MSEPAPASPPFHPEGFPVDFDSGTGEFVLTDLPAERIFAAPFLDQRLGDDQGRRTRVHWRQVSTTAAQRPIAWIFHTAFCCSTLLSRALQSPPQVVSLREPQALMRLATLALRDAPSAIEGPLRAALQLLSQPWSAGGHCLIKPTNQTNNLLPRLLQLAPGKAILLRSSLEEFLVSCCRKLPEAQTRVRWMAQHLLKDTRLARELGVEWNHPFHFVESCVLAWHAQIEWFAIALADDANDRLRSLDMRELLHDPQQVVAICADWLELGIDADLLREHVQTEFSRNAKHSDRAFDATRRAEERKRLRARYAELIDAALAWSAQFVEPVATKPADWKHLLRS